MKAGKSIVELATEIQRQAATKKDFLAPAKLLEMDNDGKLGGFNGATQSLNPLAHNQVSEYVGIPSKYYQRMLDSDKNLLAHNVNTWLKKDTSARMVRTLDGNVRAFLSDRYRPLENMELAESVLPVLGRLNLEILSCDITSTRLYLKAVDKSIMKDVPSGKTLGSGSTFFDTLSPGIVISNSEVGMGSLSVQCSVWTHLCTNLAVTQERAMRKYHVGSKHELTDGLYEMLSDKTKRLSDAATWAQVTDVVKGAFDRAKFDAYCMKLGTLSEQKIEADVVKAVEITAKTFQMSDTERSSVLTHLIQGGDLTRYGLFNAVTRTAEDLESYDRATEFEKFGGQIVELSQNEWKEIAQAA